MTDTYPAPTPELVTPPASEPLSLAELKLHCRIDDDLTADDALVTSLGVAARQWFEAALDRQLVTATWRVKLPRFTGWDVELPYPPLQSVTSITYKDVGLVTQTLSASDYDVVTYATPGRVRPRYNLAWPPTGVDPAAVTITFVAGYGAAAAVPALAKAGIALMVAHWYRNREAVADVQVMPVPLAADHIVAAARAYRF